MHTFTLSTRMNKRGLWQWVIRNAHGTHESAREFLTEHAARRDGKKMLRKLQANHTLQHPETSTN